MENSIAIANFFVRKSLADGTELTPMKVVKLTYIAHGWYMALNEGKPLLNEAVQAWKYGPVVLCVYREFRRFENRQITEMGIDAHITDPETTAFLDRVWEVYKKYSGLQLSTLTHQPDTPWDITWNQRNGKTRKEVVIPNDLIREYYIRKSQGQVAHA